jgi:hypothetical protein
MSGQELGYQKDHLETIMEDDAEYDSDEECETRIQMQLVSYRDVSHRPSIRSSMRASRASVTLNE